MSSRNFRITEHAIPGQHIREYPNSTSNCSEDILKIKIKQYVPLSNQSPSPGDVTIIAAHANGMAKELYEPLWDSLLEISRTANFHIRGIWMADMATQGASGVANESLLGNEVHWFDHSRDLLRMVDVFRAEMPLPIVGIGHSLGAAQIVNLSLMHPRLFTNLVLLDPQIVCRLGPKQNSAAIYQATAFQKDLWASREEAEVAVKKTPFLRSWDPRVVERYLDTCFRDAPTFLYPDAATGSVAKRTSKYQEMFAMGRENWDRVGMMDKPATVEERKTHPDVDETAPYQGVYQPAERAVFMALPLVRPAVLYIHGEKSVISWPEARKERVERTGTGVGGSGGVALGKVKEVVLPAGHLFPFELVDDTVKHISEYLDSEMKGWREWEERRLKEWHMKTGREKQMIDKKALEETKIMHKTLKRVAEEEKLKALKSKM